MLRVVFAGAALLLATTGTGCMYMTAVKSQQGKAFVVKASPFGGSFWNCDASSGEPVCYKVVEQPLAGK